MHVKFFDPDVEILPFFCEPQYHVSTHHVVNGLILGQKHLNMYDLSQLSVSPFKKITLFK